MPFVAKFPSIGAIQNFDQTDVPSYTSAVGAIDWVGRRLFIVSTGNNLVQVNSLDTWGELIPGTACPAGAYLFGAKFGPDEMLYSAGQAGPNDARINKFDPAAPGTLVSFFGAVGGPFQFVTDATHWAIPFDMDVLVAPDGNAYSVSTAFNASQTSNEVAVLNLTAMAWTGANFATDTPRGAVTRGANAGGQAHAYIVSTTAASLVAGFYDLAISGLGAVTYAKVADIAAADLGTGWTHVDEAPGAMLDETDGNIMAFLRESALPGYGSGNSYALGDMVTSAGHDFQSLHGTNLGNTPATSPTDWLDLGPAGPVETRLVKINPATGAVIWSVVCSPASPGIGLINSNRVRFGLYCVVETSPSFSIHMHQIRTLQGTDTPVALNTIDAATQFFSDETGEVVVACNSYSQLGTPVPHGSTPSNFTGFALLGSATPPFQPPGGLVVPRRLNIDIHYHRVKT